MDLMCDFHSWSKQPREEALREAQRRSLVKQAKTTQFEGYPAISVGFALSGVLGLLR